MHETMEFRVTASSASSTRTARSHTQIRRRERRQALHPRLVLFAALVGVALVVALLGPDKLTETDLGSTEPVNSADAVRSVVATASTTIEETVAVSDEN